MMPAISGPWTRAQIETYLTETRVPLRLAVQTGEGGPLVVSLWYVLQEGALWCATQQQADVARHLAADPRCAFEIATDQPPYRGVRGQGRATLVPAEGTATLRQLLARYAVPPDSSLACWLLGRAAAETAIRIVPRWVASWDYTERMR